MTKFNFSIIKILFSKVKFNFFKKRTAKSVKTLIVLLFLSLLTSPALAEIPFAVTPTKVVVEGDIPLDLDTQSFNYLNGWPDIYGETKDGSWTNIKIDGLHYRLTFWNVGALGGVKGYWFWKTDYKDADLIISYNVADSGVIMEKQGEFNGMPTFKSKPATEELEFKKIHYKLKFSGSPSGSFEEVAPYKNKLNKPLSGALYEGGSYALFKVPSVTAQESAGKKNINPPLISYFSDKELPIDSNVWFGWSMDSIGCEGGGDSGVRFVEFSGQVEVYPDSDPEDSRPAAIDDVLKVCDHIVTEEESVAIISFADMTTFKIGPNSNFVLERPKGPKSKFSLLAGETWANIKHVLKGEEVEITLNQAVAGIKGTTLVLKETGVNQFLK